MEIKLRVKFLKDGVEAVEYLQLDLEYDTAQQAERASLVFSKNGSQAGLSRGKKILLAVVDPLDRKLNSCLHSLLSGAEF